MERKRYVFLDLSMHSLIQMIKGTVSVCIILYAVCSAK
jgi:hypothetical protein